MLLLVIICKTESDLKKSYFELHTMVSNKENQDFSALCPALICRLNGVMLTLYCLETDNFLAPLLLSKRGLVFNEVARDKSMKKNLCICCLF